MNFKSKLFIFKMVSSLQQIILRKLPTKNIISSNLIHLLGFQNRFVSDFINHQPQPIDEYFLSAILDTGNTSFFWLQTFIHRHIHRLPLNVAMLACWQGNYTEYESLLVFAMRTDNDKVALFVYNQLKDDQITNNIFNQKKSCKWLKEDWDFINNHLEFEKFFYISSLYQSSKT